MVSNMQTISLPEQLRRKQCLISSKGPSQNRPLFEGGGLSHIRYLDLYPGPQVVSHGVHAVQTDQLPSTADIKYCVCLLFKKLLCLYKAYYKKKLDCLYRKFVIEISTFV